MNSYTCITDFIKDFSTKEACLQFLYDLKWSNGFTCSRCGHNRPQKGRSWHYLRCSHCLYDESATANTVFHKLKFPLEKAFVIVYQLSTMKKGMSSCEISRQHNIHQETAWFFKRKVQQAMKQNQVQLLSANVEVDETYLGGKKAGKTGRGAGGKQIVQVALEVDYPEDGDQIIMRSGNARVLIDSTTASLKLGIEQMVATDAVVTTDEWQAYVKALEGRWHDPIPSSKGSNFVKLHWHIFNLKNWLKGIHHSVSSQHLQSYLDEFYFRFNSRNHLNQNPIRLVRTMMQMPWMPYHQVVAN